MKRRIFRISIEEMTPLSETRLNVTDNVDTLFIELRFFTLWFYYLWLSAKCITASPWKMDPPLSLLLEFFLIFISGPRTYCKDV